MINAVSLFVFGLLILQGKPQLFDKSEFLPLDPTQQLIFPPELIVSPFARQEVNLLGVSD